MVLDVSRGNEMKQRSNGKRVFLSGRTVRRTKTFAKISDIIRPPPPHPSSSIVFLQQFIAIPLL
jgi:hypothetical protein